MAELIEITRALELVKDFEPLQRILLTCSGTLQGTLSAYFGREIVIKLVKQNCEEDGVIQREANLHEGAMVVCLATSQLTIERDDVREKVIEGEMGIGQVLETLEVRPSFELHEVGDNEHFFWRVYSLRGPGVVYKIRESFPKLLYGGAASPGKELSP